MKNKSVKYLIILFLLSYFNINAQKKNFIVTSVDDTITVDKIKVKYDKIIVKQYSTKKKYSFDDVKSYYDSKKKKHFEKVKSPPANSIFIKNIDFHNEYVFLNRLTNGKVKLFCHIHELSSPITSSNPFPLLDSSDTLYFIAIYNSKLEPIKSNSKLRLNKHVYEVLKIYLYGNNEISKRLDDMYLSKPVTKRQQIIELINDYNTWVESN